MPFARLPLVLSLLVVGCGQSHTTDAGPLDAGPFDAGPFDAGPVASGCAEIMAAPEGAACEAPGWTDVCRDEDDHYCAIRGARCVDERVVHVEHAWTVFRAPEPDCGDEGGTSLEGEGPEGSFSLVRGAGAFTSGFLNSAELLFTTGAPVEACAEPRLVVGIQPTAESIHDYEGEGPANALLTVGDAMHRLTGTVTVDTQEDFDLSGTLLLEGEGYRVHGTFRVLACRDLGMTSI